MSAAVAIAFLAGVRRGCSLPAIATEDVNFPAINGILRKTVISSRLRLVLVVGLEGTGHAFGEHPKKR